MCTVLSEHGWPIAPSTYYEHITRGPSERMLTDARVIDAIYKSAETGKFEAV